MLISLANLTADHANAAVDWLCKSVEERLLDDPHPTDPLIGAMEEASTMMVRRGLLGLYTAMLEALVTGPAMKKARPSWLPSRNACGKLEQKILRVAPGSLTFTDYLDVIDCLILRYLPPDVLENEARALAVKQYLVGHLRSRKVPTVTPVVTVAALPGTIKQAAILWTEMRPYDKAVLAAAQANAARLVTDLSGSARSRMKKLILDAERRRVNAGAESFAPAPLTQQLADTFGELNRDWRRIAVTETAMNSADGFLATQPIGEQVQWLAHEGACDYCRLMNGRIFTMVSPTAKNKDPETQMWPGKQMLNIGRAMAKRKRLDNGAMVDRADDELLVPAIPAHPNCRCIPIPYVSEETRAA